MKTKITQDEVERMVPKIGFLKRTVKAKQRKAPRFIIHSTNIASLPAYSEISAPSVINKSGAAIKRIDAIASIIFLLFLYEVLLKKEQLLEVFRLCQNQIPA